MLRGYSDNNGTLEHYGDTVLATNIYNTWVHDLPRLNRTRALVLHSMLVVLAEKSQSV
jgi:hypothetical protein